MTSANVVLDHYLWKRKIKNPNLSPASTAGLGKIIRSIFFSNNIVNATATAKKVFPVPDGPVEIIMSFSFKALT